jgi:hypothetical protein
MASVKFAKGSEEWQMFIDFWTLCQKYWIPEESDEWWENALHEIDAFAKKYGSTVFIRGMCMTLINRLEAEYAKMDRKREKIKKC